MSHICLFSIQNSTFYGEYARLIEAVSEVLSYAEKKLLNISLH